MNKTFHLEYRYTPAMVARTSIAGPIPDNASDHTSFVFLSFLALNRTELGLLQRYRSVLPKNDPSRYCEPSKNDEVVR